MISSRAVCKSSTLTGVHTFLIFTLLCGGAVWVHKAFIRSAEVIGVADVVGFASAEAAMIPGTANGIHPTVLIQARVLAFSVVTGKDKVTLGIALAASCGRKL